MEDRIVIESKPKKKVIPLPIAILILVAVVVFLCCGVSVTFFFFNSNSPKDTPERLRNTLPATFTPDGELNSNIGGAPVIKEYSEGSIIFRVYNVRAHQNYEDCGFSNDSCLEFYASLVDLSYEFTAGGITKSYNSQTTVKEGSYWELPIQVDRGSFLYLSVYNGAIVACETAIIRNGDLILIDAAESRGTFAVCSVIKE